MAAGHLETGRAGEDAACKHLKKKRYKLLERNLSIGGGELDLICSKGGMIVFVEVRTRDKSGPVTPAESVTRAKMARLARAASAYLTQHDLWERPCRFDLVSVRHEDGKYEVEHLENVFDLGQAVDSGDTPWQPW